MANPIKSTSLPGAREVRNVLERRYDGQGCNDLIFPTSAGGEKARIAARISSARAGNFGGCKSVGDGVSEMRIDFGPGYRVYYGQEGLHIYLLILGGAKSSQTRDIAKAKEMWRIIKEERQ